MLIKLNYFYKVKEPQKFSFTIKFKNKYKMMILKMLDNKTLFYL